MKKNIVSSVIILSAFITQQSNAGCPTLPAKDLAYYLCPVVGAYNVVPQTTVVYQRPLDVVGALSNICSAVSKTIRTDDKKYDGVESSLKEGNLVCHYELPEEWQKKASVTKFSLTSKITTPPSLQGAVCPVLKFDHMVEFLTQTKVSIAGGPEWQVHQEGAKKLVGNVFSGLKGGFHSLIGSAPEGTIKGQIGEGTTAFTHTCTYTYHSGATPKEMVLHGKMSLELLKHVNDQIAKHSE
jgi:hypothetical protein